MNGRSLLAALILLASTAAGAAEDGAFTPVEPRTVDTAAIEVTNRIGRTHVLADILPGAPAIVHFWATWCAPCRDELPNLAGYAGTLAERGLRDRLIVIAVEPAKRESIDRFLKDDLGLDGFVTLQDRDGRSGPVFGLFGMPETVLLDADGRIVRRHAGVLDWSDDAVRAELSTHLGG